MFIIIWFRHLPQISMDLSEWTPFIQNNWHRKHYMKFVYVLQIIIFLIPYYFRADFTHINIFYLIIIGICVFIIHEFLHVIVIKKKGDISLTCSGIFFLVKYKCNSIQNKILDLYEFAYYCIIGRSCRYIVLYIRKY